MFFYYYLFIYWKIICIIITIYFWLVNTVNDLVLKFYIEKIDVVFFQYFIYFKM